MYANSNWASGPGPSDGGGRIWLTIDHVLAAADDAAPLYLLNIKLSDPDAAQSLADTLFTDDVTARTG
ncbi:hypothetical protein [Streptomyces tendae]|uniref:hypothetical protein n=1 Tax=Streptomyces tendae TaxID=1932 RepID=UPI0033C6C305